MKKKRLHISGMALAFIILMTALSSCAVKKNNAQTRWWHSFTTRYNVYYNATLAYIDASLEKEKGNKDNYTEMIPLYTVGNKQSKELGKGNYDKAIEKCQKAIHLHSITKRPEWTKNRKKTDRDIEWLNRKEYNPFLWRAWMLMGRSQFYKGEFDEAASTFTHMSRMYRTQPAIYAKARAWLAKCYIEQDWMYDAEDVIRNMQRDSIDWKSQKEWDYTLADYYLHNGDMARAAEYLRKVVKHEMRSQQRAREYFLLGQVETSLGNKEQAYKAFKKVLSQNPPYQVAFNAQIAMTEVLANSGQAKSMISKLRRMASNENNSEYLDQVYYAIGNIYLSQKDTTNAIAAYEKGNKESTRSGIEKGVLLLHLGDLYWAKEKYGDAGRCYGEAIGLLDKDRPDYEQLSERSKILDELVPFTDAIQLQDSLQNLAKMDEKSRNQTIDRVIAELKKKEKEEKDKEAEAQASQQQQRNNTGRTPAAQTNKPTAQQGGKWYFYNPTAVQQGKQAFERQWGRRDNTDNWQRSNKTVVNSLTEDVAENDTISNNGDTAANDSIATNEDGKADVKVDEEAASDPHKREYYLAQIPFTEEQVQASNEIIKDGLFNSGKIFKDKLDNLPLAEKAFSRLMSDFPDFEPMDEVYYHMFLLYSRSNDSATADTYVNAMKTSYPDSKWTILITDPYFVENARFGTHIEDSLYTATYEAFLSDNHDVVMANTKISDTRFALGNNRDKFLFISALSQLNAGHADDCIERLKKLLEEYPESGVGQIAGMIINGVNAGRKLYGAHFSMNDVWDRRANVMDEQGENEERAFSPERDIPFNFMLVYEPDSISENKLLFQLAKYNFTSFIVRNFDLEIVDDGGIHRMMVSGFRSFDEARTYARLLYQNEAMKELTAQCRPIIISNDNLMLLGEQFSYNDYADFYAKNFQPLKPEKEYMLYEPDGVREEKTRREVNTILPSENAAPEAAKPVDPKNTEEEDTDNDNGIILQDVPMENTQAEEITIQEEPVENTQAEEIILQEEPVENTQTEEIILQEEPVENTQAETLVIVEATEEVKETEEIIIEENPTEEKEDETLILVEDETSTATEEEPLLIEEEGTEEPVTIEEEEEPVIIDDDEYKELQGF